MATTPYLALTLRLRHVIKLLLFSCRFPNLFNGDSMIFSDIRKTKKCVLKSFFFNLTLLSKIVKWA